MKSVEAPLRLASLAYRMAIDHDFVEKLRERSPELANEEPGLLSPDEIAALEGLLARGFSTSELTADAQSSPMEGRWWLV